MQFLKLGASLYTPSTRADLASIGNGVKLPRLRSVIVCMEDAIRPEEISHALRNLEQALPRLKPVEMLRFVRPRDPATLRTLLGMEGVGRLTGFVLPKVTNENLDDYFAAFSPDDGFQVMPTLETREAFDIREMLSLRDRLLEERYRRRILSLRIGGNDLLGLLGVRRPRGRTIYETPLGVVIAQLVTVFRPHGFNLTAPVFEHLDQGGLLRREAAADVGFGLFGKSAIHPQQVPLIEAGYRVSRADREAAERILQPGSPAVFRLHNSMCERTTHQAWAKLTLARAELYGLSDGV
jgi:citrate lyase beta subunit